MVRRWVGLKAHSTCHLPLCKASALPGLNPHSDSIREELVPSTQEEVESELQAVLHTVSSRSVTVTKRRKKKASQVWWCMPTKVPNTQKTEEERSFEPYISKSAWPTVRLSFKTNKHFQIRVYNAEKLHIIQILTK